MAAKRKASTRDPALDLAALARNGRWEEALAQLVPLSDAGSRAASLTAAELLGASFDWRGCLTHAARFLADPSVARTGNAFTDTTRLVRRAVAELKDPSLLEPIAASIPSRWHPMRDATLLKDTQPPSALPGPPQREAYDAAVARARGEKRFQADARVFAAHCFALARSFKVDEELLRLWSEEDGWGWWDCAIDAARVQARRGDDAGAWGTVMEWAPRRVLMDALQVFPVVLLTDPWLSALTTKERARELLATPVSV